MGSTKYPKVQQQPAIVVRKHQMNSSWKLPQGAGANLRKATRGRSRGHHWNDGLYEALHLQYVPIRPERTIDDRVWLFFLLVLGRLNKNDNQDRATDLPSHILGGWIWRNSWPFPGSLFHHPLGQYVLSWEIVWNGDKEILIHLISYYLSLYSLCLAD